ncbi:MAG: hypothetical protein KGH71_05130, partial [Candidatus Micrarchaeota archaeon]|nr:hypothetical protein [Candidatus Micrarchaeota archaeon]
MAVENTLVSNPWAIVYPSYAEHKGALIFEDLKDKRRFILPDGSYLKLLAYCAKPRPRDQALQDARSLSPKGASRL